MTIKILKLRQCVIFLLIAIMFPYSAVASPIAETFTLKNGMQVVVIPNAKIPAVAHVVWYKVGAANEEVGKSGIAHFLEHLMFKETDSLKDGEFSKLIAYNGGTENAFTGSDYTAYFQKISKDNLELAMMLEAERMKNLHFDKKSIERERDVVMEERNMRIDNNPEASLEEQMRAALYLNHPYGRPVIGWRHEIEKFSVKDTKAFYEKFYSPHNAILIVSGDITALELKPLAEKYYGNIPSSGVFKTTPPKEPEHIAPRYISLKDKRAKKEEWRRYYLAPSIVAGKTEHAIPLLVLSQIFGGGETSRIYKSLVVEQEIAVDAGAFYDELSLGKTVFGIYITPKNGVSFRQIGDAVKREISTFIQSDISETELQRAKNLLTASTIYARDGIIGIAFIYGQIISAGLDISYLDNWSDIIQKVTKDDIIKAASYVFSEKRSVTGVLSPESEDK